MENFTMLQFFEWYYPADGSLWLHFKSEAQRLKELGFDSVWLPPAHKGMEGDQSPGYDSYDLYDLGEFNQKGSIRTKYGTKQQYLEAIAAGQAAGLQVYADLVFNHMGGADEKETITVRRVAAENRNEFTSEEMEIEAYTRFTFPGRKGQYSAFNWDFQCFSGVDYDDRTKETAIFSIQNQYGEGFQQVLAGEYGNYDYLMCCDIDYRNPAVREEILRWGKWFYQTVPVDGFRLDAIKHIDPQFFNEWLDAMRSEFNQEFFTVGEYWAPYDLAAMLSYIQVTQGRMHLFDAPLQANFYQASQEGDRYDLRTILNGSLVQASPQLAVTLVENHDTQPLQSLEQTIAHWFRPLAYALILLRQDGYPCVFYTDLYGSQYQGREEAEITLQILDELAPLLEARKKRAYGLQRDYFDEATCIGWTREGEELHPGSGCAVLLSTGDVATKRMEVGRQFAGLLFRDYLGKVSQTLVIDPDGWAEFSVEAGSISVWGLDQTTS